MANSRADDGQWVVQQYVYLHNRQPTVAELNQAVDQLQAGMPRATWTATAEKYGDEAADATRIFTQVIGRPPTAKEVNDMATGLRNGTVNRADLTTYLQGKPEALLKKPTPAGPTADQQDAKALMTDYLHQYGLDSLGDWAWSEIQSGKTLTQVTLDLRNQPAYKARFPAMDARRAAGLPPITEAQYIQSEGQFRDIMRSNGMPPGFWDNPSDYTGLIANDISPVELQHRVQDGWAKVTNAPPAVRQIFGQWFGPEGDTALAAYFVDPTKAEALLTKAADEARTGGYATLFGMNVTQSRAEQIYNFGKTSDQAIQAMNQLNPLTPLFSETVSENKDYTKENEGLNATLGMDATSQNELQRRARTRFANTAGGGGALTQQTGVLGAGAAQ